jgi:ABC-type Fe3+/spermidine/putrescine transport system ATPase subunit
MYLSFEKLTKHYGDVTALHEITFGVERGQFVSLLGPSGCGKTTTLMVLAGFENPTSGRVLLDSKDLGDLPPEKREVGVVFQHYALFPHMTVAENVAFGLLHGPQRMGRSEATVHVERLLHLVDLASFGQRRPAELSAGQQQRVAIARSLAPQPRVLCFDEPLSALDALLREKLRLEIRRLQRELDLTVLYVTHDQEEALAISDQVVVMNEGEILQIGTPWQVYDRPANAFVAGFIGRGSVLSGKLVSAGEQVVVRLGNEQTIALPTQCWCGNTPARPGISVGMLLRSERVGVSGAPESHDCRVINQELHLPGYLLEAEFLGAATQIQIDSPVGRLIASAPAAEIGRWQGSRGNRVTLTCHVNDVRLMPVDSGS